MKILQHIKERARLDVHNGRGREIETRAAQRGKTTAIFPLAILQQAKKEPHRVKEEKYICKKKRPKVDKDQLVE